MIVPLNRVNTVVQFSYSGDKMFKSYSSCPKLDSQLWRKNVQSVTVDYQHVVKIATNDTNCKQIPFKTSNMLYMYST